jgi:hypothetical protein
VVTGRLEKMDLIALNAKERRSWRKATTAVALCFVVAGTILGASLLWPAVPSTAGTVTAMPR